MLLASLLVPLAVVAIVFLTQRLRLPAFLAILATVVVYGIAADMTFQSVGKAFGLGFTAALEHAGLLVVAGALVEALVLRQPLGTGTSALVGRWQPSALAGRSWAPLLLVVGASGGLARVFDETGMAELLAEYALHPRFGILTPFLAAAIVKTMQGNSLTAVLTASGMVEPMLPALGLDSASGRALAAAAAGAGSMAICHVNDPFFWIAASMGRLSPGRALYVISLGSVVMAIGALVVLAAVKQFL
jgi:H+/gluconate symporter-like permease